VEPGQKGKVTVIEREATIRWLGNPPSGVPRLSVGSESVKAWPLEVNPDAEHPLATSPGELLAGAIGGVFAWLAAEELVKEGTPARELIAYVMLTVSSGSDEPMDLALSGISCELVGRVPGLSRERLEAAAQAAMTRCIAALGMRSDSVAVSVEATLEGA
jgi:organic hydroperoxide reductase OsmC/OhrA